MLSPERMLYRKLENKKSGLDLWESEGPTVLPQINLQRLAKHLLCAKYYAGDGDIVSDKTDSCHEEYMEDSMQNVQDLLCRIYG